jgi:hypothetical protein
MSKSKNLVMGFATNQSERSMQIFTRSLRDVYPQDECDLVLVTNRYEPFFADLAANGVTFASTSNNYSKRTGRAAKLVNRVFLHAFRMLHGRSALAAMVPEIADAYPVLFETWHHPHFVRWLCYRRFLTLNRQYGKVLLADVKDVVFQAPFFDAIPASRVSLFEQGEIYGQCDWDTRWYREAWGEQELKKVLGKPAICIGTIAGTHAQVLSLVDELSESFLRKPFGRIEQAMFNYLIYNEKLKTPYQVVQNVEGPIATLANPGAHQQVRVDGGLIRRSMDGRAVPIVHMFDRFPDTRAACDRLCSAGV